MTVASGLGAAKVAAGDAPVAGQGDDVVLMHGTATKARITNRGQSNFIVYVISIRLPSINLQSTRSVATREPWRWAHPQ